MHSIALAHVCMYVCVEPTAAVFLSVVCSNFPDQALDLILPEGVGLSPECGFQLAGSLLMALGHAGHTVTSQAHRERIFRAVVPWLGATVGSVRTIAQCIVRYMLDPAAIEKHSQGGAPDVTQGTNEVHSDSLQYVVSLAAAVDDKSHAWTVCRKN
jgi:hypothetical protein